MSLSSLWLISFLISLWLGLGVLKLEASHHVFAYSHLQTSQLSSFPTKQPYRTAFHFQPSKNWMNGNFILNPFINSIYLIHIVIISNWFSSLLCLPLHIYIILWFKIGQIDVFVQADPNGKWFFFFLLIFWITLHW